MKKLHSLLIIVTLFVTQISLAQSDNPCGAPALPTNVSCVNTGGTNSGATASPGVPVPGCANYSGGDVWYTITVPPTGDVLITTSTNGGMTDGGMAIYSGTCGSLSLVDCDDDGGVGLMSSITLSGQTPGATLWIRVWEYGNNNNGSFDICAVEVVSPTNVSCDVPDPICSGTPILFTAQANGTQASVVNPGNNYGCLFSTPNPSWYYLEISGPGDLVIDITAGADVDFALWGPYPDLATAIATCESHPAPLDCSYSTSPTEQAFAPGVLVGEVYVLLVTNYAAVVQSITLADAGANTATTNCAIVLPVELISFEGELKEEHVSLSWTTASEESSDYFAVERSSDGISWSLFDIVKGAGNSTELVNYSTRDDNPNEELNYYRLRQFDFDGKVTISNTIVVKSKSNESLQLFPNPASESVLVSSKYRFDEIRIVDVSGSEVMLHDQTSKFQEHVDISGLKRGVYMVSIETSNGIVTERLVIE